MLASTIEAGGFDSFDDDLEEATIEQSVAEINQAIRQSTARKAHTKPQDKLGDALPTSNLTTLFY